MCGGRLLWGAGVLTQCPTLALGGYLADGVMVLGCAGWIVELVETRMELSSPCAGTQQGPPSGLLSLRKGLIEFAKAKH